MKPIPEPFAPDIPSLDIPAIRALVTDAERLKRGAELFDKQGVLRPARHQSKLFAEVKASKGTPYKVSVAFESAPTSIKASCTCPDAIGCPVCKHAAALLVAWSRAPESFVVSDSAPADGSVKVKEGKTTAADLMKGGVEQVSTLLRELGTAGVAAAGKDRIEQIRKLGESLRESELRRLSSRTMDLAHLLSTHGQGRAPIDAVRYADLVADMRITARKIEKHVAGEPLEDRYVEELIGKTWKETDRKPISGMKLVEVAFTTRHTTDDHIVRESRFIDVTTGHHYGEKQIVHESKDRQSDRKRSYATSLLDGASGSIYPSFPPFRLKLVDVGAEVPLSEGVVQALALSALPDVGAALAALQEHRRDVFAPDLFPVSIRVDRIFARGSRLEAIDEKGYALHICDDPGIEEQIGSALHEGRLIALIGDIGIDAAIPTLWPLALVIEGSLGVELRTIHEEPAPLKKSRLTAPSRRPPREPSSWPATARAAGISSAAIALGEVREELAVSLVAGLAGMSARITGSLVARLQELDLPKLAALLLSCAERLDPAQRLDDFIKVYQALGMLLVRLAGAAHVDPASLERVPGYESVHVVRPVEALDPREIQAMRARGSLNRYEAALQYARHYERLPPEELSAHMYPTWADGSAGPYVARAFAGRGPIIIDAAERALGAPQGLVSKITAIRVLQAVAGLRAQDVLHRIVHTEQDPTLRALAEDALDSIELHKGQRDVVRKRREAAGARLGEHIKRLLTAPQKEKRIDAVLALVELGHWGARSALRQAFIGDVTLDVREEAAYALARLGDTEMVEMFVRMLAARTDPNVNTTETDIAARALGLLGDVRGLDELLAAYAGGYSPIVIADAIKGFGPAAMEPLIDLIEGRPEIANRMAARSILADIPGELLGDCLARRLGDRKGSMASDPAAFTERAHLLLRLSDVQLKSRKPVAKAICEHLGESEDKADAALVRLAQKALGVR